MDSPGKKLTEKHTYRYILAIFFNCKNKRKKITYAPKVGKTSFLKIKKNTTNNTGHKIYNNQHLLRMK